MVRKANDTNESANINIYPNKILHVKDIQRIFGYIEVKIPLSEKILLNVNEASEYSGIGISKIRELMNTRCSDFVVLNGKKKLLKRRKFEQWIEQQSEL